MKKVLVLVALVSFLTASNVFANDAGDLMLLIEPEIGLSIPTIDLQTANVGYVSKYKGYSSTALGLEFAFQVRAQYWFLDFLGASVGLGGRFIFDTWTFQYDGNTSAIKCGALFTRAYLTVPFGVNFSFDALALGAGLSLNSPLGGASALFFGENKNSKMNDGFYLNDYLGWYFDIGFNTAGKKDAGSGFGMALRLAGSLTDELGGYKWTDYGSWHNKLKYQDFSISLVFQPTIQLVNFNSGS